MVSRRPAEAVPAPPPNAIAESRIRAYNHRRMKGGERMRYRSQVAFQKSWENVPYRACLKSMGFTDFELQDRPLIGIANSWNNIVPGHYIFKELAEFVRNGIYAGGGTAMEFGVIAGCDGLTDKHVGGNYSLPSREVICDSIQTQAEMARFDAIVLLGSCDKIVPGMLKAAARLNIPAIMVTGGPMMGGREFDGRKSDQTSPEEAKGMLSAGRISEQDVLDLEDTCCPGCGSCAFLGTANSMCAIAEALGMSLTGSAMVPAAFAKRKRIAFESGLKICELARRNITARQVITADALRNAIKVSLGICGSTNTVLHLCAIAREAELDLNVMEEFRKLGPVTPYIAKVNPAAPYDMEAFYYAGGIPRIMERMSSVLSLDVMTCTGQTLRENLSAYSYEYPADDRIIRTMEQPFSPNGALAVLQGNLAPDTAITKPGAFDPSLYHFEGKAKVYDSEEAANAAILAGEVVAGDVVVIRYEGPKGGPGMREMCRAMKYLYGRGLAKTTALVTDGRFSGTNNGCFVGHVSPEAAEGGPIAIVENGDEIVIDVNQGLLEVRLSDEEIQRRLSQWKRPEKEIPFGYLRRYAKYVSSASQGAVFLD